MSSSRANSSSTRKGKLAAGWSVESAGDMLSLQFLPASYHFLVVERGWSQRRFVQRMQASLAATLLESYA